MFTILSKELRKKIEAIINNIYEQVNESELEAELLHRRVQFITKELEILKVQEDKLLKELAVIAVRVNKLKEKDLQSE